MPPADIFVAIMYGICVLILAAVVWAIAERDPLTIRPPALLGLALVLLVWTMQELGPGMGSLLE